MNSGGYQLTSAAPFVFIVFVLYSIGSYLLYLYSRAVVFIVPAEIEIQAGEARCEAPALDEDSCNVMEELR